MNNGVKEKNGDLRQVLIILFDKKEINYYLLLEQ